MHIHRESPFLRGGQAHTASLASSAGGLSMHLHRCGLPLNSTEQTAGLACIRRFLPPGSLQSVCQVYMPCKWPCLRTRTGMW